MREHLAEEYGDDLLFADGFDAAILGVVARCGQDPFVLYDREKCIDILTATGLSYEDACEHFEFNIIGAWVGSRTPGFLMRPDQ